MNLLLNPGRIVSPHRGTFIHFYRNKYPRLLDIIQNKIFQALLLCFTLYFIFTNFHLQDKSSYYLSDFCSCLLFGLFILSAVQEGSIINFENRLLKTLGKVSFGIYLFHPPVCRLTLLFMTKWCKIPDSFFAYDILYPLLATTIACVIAFASYEIYEKRFLKLKSKFSTVKTRI